MKAKLSVALLIAMSASALLAAQSQAAHRSAKPAVYRGKTSQGKAIQIASSPKQIAPIRFKVKMLCRDGSLLFGDATDFEATPLSASGSFSDTQYGNTDTVIWKGKVKKNQVKGTLRVKDRLQSGVRCDSGPISFTAKRANH
jgi:uncharacterized protein YdeI (BOF family)